MVNYIKMLPDIGDKYKIVSSGVEGVVSFIGVISIAGKTPLITLVSDDDVEYTKPFSELEYVSMGEVVWGTKPNKMRFDMRYAGQVCLSLLRDGCSIHVYPVDDGMKILVVLQNWPDQYPPELAFVRAKNHAHYWVNEAPFRRAPNNSSDDYNPKKYP